MEWFLRYGHYPLMAVAAVFLLVWLYIGRKRLTLPYPAQIGLGLLALGFAVFCVKAFAALEAWDLSGFRNMSIFGAVLFMPLCLRLEARLTKQDADAFLDVYAVPMVFMLMLARFNCLRTGCCYGRLIPGTEFRVPTRELEIVFYVLLLVWFFLRTKRGTTNGLLYPVYMTAYGLVRFVLEFFRHTDGTDLFHLAHLWAILSLTAGACLWMDALRRGGEGNSAKPRHGHKQKRQQGGKK